MTIVGDVANVVKKVESVVVHEAAAIKADLEKIFGKAGTDAYLKAVEAAAEEQGFKIVKIFVGAVKTAFPNGPGSVLKAIATAGIVPALEQAGITVGKVALNTAIEAALASL